jgi:hypothetical protein
MKTILACRCYKQNGHKAWIALRDVGDHYDILMGVIQIGEADPQVTIKPNGKNVPTLIEAMVDFKARCNFYVDQGWQTDGVFQKLIDGLIE